MAIGIDRTGDGNQFFDASSFLLHFKEKPGWQA